MAVLSPVAKQQFHANGVPAAGYLLYTYATGTSTPLATYKDQAGAVAHTNPIVLDADGYVPGGGLYLTDGLTYDYVLKTAADAPVWTQEKVAAPSASVSFQHAGSAGVARPMLDKARDSVSLKDFGAIGDGTVHPLSEYFSTLAAAQAVYPDASALTNSVDACATQVAFDWCIANGKELEVPDGTYMLQSNHSSTGGFGVIWLRFTASGQSLRVRGKGKGLSVFKEIDGTVLAGGNFTKMFYLYLPDATNVAIDKVSFTDLTLDKNGASNGTPADPWAYQQAHIFQCISTAASGSTVNDFEFVNIELKDKVAGGINLAMLTAAGRVLIRGVTESGWSAQFGERGDLELTAFCDNIRVIDCNVRYSQTEPELGYEASATYPRSYYYSNSKLRVLQLQEPASASYYANVYMDNCEVSVEFSTQGLMAHVNNSTVNLSREIYARRGKFANCTILMDYDSGANTCDAVYIYNGNSNSNYPQEWTFDNCSFVLNTDDTGVLATGFQIGSSTQAKTTAIYDKVVRLIGCTFDPRVQYVNSSYSMGSYSFVKCKVRCWGPSAFVAGADSTNVGALYLSGNDYSELPSATTIVNLVRNNELWTFEWDERLHIDTYRMTNSGGATFAGYKVRPTISSSARPTTTTKLFNAGDVTRNLAPSASAPVTEWVCTVGGNPGTHVATKWLTTKGTTANRPTLHASDIGVTYLDTTLSAAGELITWTGTAWVAAIAATSIAAAPAYIGQRAVVSGEAYVATGTASTADWKRITNAVPITSIAATPSFTGQFAVVAGVGYMAVGTASSADWKQITA